MPGTNVEIWKSFCPTLDLEVSLARGLRNKVVSHLDGFILRFHEAR